MDNYIISFLEFIGTHVDVPQPYGAFHIFSLIVMVALSILLCVLFRNCSDRTMRIIIAIAWGFMFVFEILEQFVIGTTVMPDGTLSFTYQLYRFPFQLCSTALWILPLIILIPEGKLRDGLIGYMTLFSFLGGLLVMATVGDVYASSLITNIHTMIHHGLQVVLGIFFISHERHKYNLRYFVGGVIAFIVQLGIACILNEIMHEVILAYNLAGHAFNMFYVSPYYPCTLPILSEVYKVVPYPAFLLIYALGFILLAFIVYFVASLINHIVDYVRHREEYVK